MKYNSPKNFKTPDSMVVIYYLYDPKYPSDIRYIGKTKNSLPNRVSAHVANAIKAKSGSCYKHDWIMKIFEEGRSPNIAILDIVPESIWEETEKYYIKSMRELGYKLTNLSVGGEAGNPVGYAHTKEMRQKRSEWMKNNKNACGEKSMEHRKKISESNIGKGKKIIMINPKTLLPIKSFNSMRQATKELGFEGHAAISNACRGRSKTAYGYKWSYNG